MSYANKTARAKVGAPKKARSAAERREAQRILFAARVGRPSKYRPDHHPEDIVAYFRQSYDALEEPQRVETRSGNVRWVQPPVPPPTLAGYAARVGVRRETLWAWGRRHEEFGEAVGLCKAMQEHLVIQMGCLGAYPPGFAMFMLRNLWRGEAKKGRERGVVLHFDAQDAEA